MNNDSQQNLGNRPPWPRAAIAVWALLAVLIGAPFSFAIWNHAFGPPKTINDFVQEWTSARNYFAGEPIYLPLEESMERHFGREMQLGVIQYNAHPPASVLISLPFCKFPYAQALHVWNAVSLLALAAAVGLTVGNLKTSPWLLLPIFTLLITSNPLAQQVLQGQLNLVLLLLLTGFWVAARQQHWFWAGILVGIAGAIKLFPLYLGLYFLGRRQWKAVVGVGLGFAALNGAAWACFGESSFRTFFLEIAPAVAQEFQSYWPNASLSGFFKKNLDGSVGHVQPWADLPMIANLLTMVSALLITVASGWQCWKANSAPAQDRAIAACALAMLLVSPITWDHYFVLLTPFLIVLWMQADRAWERAVLLALFVLLFFVRPTWIWHAWIPGDGELAFGPGQTASVGAPWHALTILSYQFYGLLTLWLLAFAGARKQPDAAVSGL